MADFITHVDLHDATNEDGRALDLAMASAAFATVMRGHGGFDYKLPPATYFSQAVGLNSEQVRNIALGVVRTLGRQYDIMTISGDLAYFLHPAR